MPCIGILWSHSTVAHRRCALWMKRSALHRVRKPLCTFCLSRTAPQFRPTRHIIARKFSPMHVTCIDDARMRMRDAGVAGETALLETENTTHSIARCPQRYAVQMHADLVVMGTLGRTGAPCSRQCGQSVSAALNVSGAPCPSNALSGAGCIPHFERDRKLTRSTRVRFFQRRASRAQSTRAAPADCRPD